MKTGTNAMAMELCFSLACSLRTFYASQDHQPEVALPKGNWALPTGQSDGHILSIEVPSSKMTLARVKLAQIY